MKELCNFCNEMEYIIFYVFPWRALCDKSECMEKFCKELKEYDKPETTISH